jgi:predicted lipase
VFLVFRGTRTGSEWLKNIKIRLSPYPHAALGKVHDGFIEAYDMFRRTIIDSLNGLGRGKRLYITGHSLGAGLATLAAPDIVCATSFGLPVVYTFASPRVGDLQFADGFNRLMKGASFRIANTCDLVVSIPFPVPFLGFIGGYFTHVETPVDFTTQREDLDKNHAIDTYLSAMREAGKGEGMFRSLFRRRARGSAAPAASR